MVLLLGYRLETAQITTLDKASKQATKIATQFDGSQAMCELTGAKSYDRLVGYCTVGGTDFGIYMMQNSSCEVCEKYDVWNMY